MKTKYPQSADPYESRDPSVQQQKCLTQMAENLILQLIKTPQAHF